MTRLLAILALAALSCATSRAGERPCPKCEPSPGARSLGAGQGALAAMPAPECRPAKLRAIPTEPVIDWMPKGCPAQFLACFSGSDGEQMRLYLQSIRQWTRDAERGCSRGGR